MESRNALVVMVVMAAVMVAMAAVIVVRCCQAPIAQYGVTSVTPEDRVEDPIEPSPTPTCAPPEGGGEAIIIDPFGKPHCGSLPPKDPGGHVMDAVIPGEPPEGGPTPVAEVVTEVTLFRVPNMLPDLPGPGHVAGRCYNMDSKPPVGPGLVGNWENVPLATAAQILTGIPVPIGELGPPSPANPDLTDVDTGLYGWWAPTPRCYFVRAVRPDQAPRFSPIVGVVYGVADVTDLHHCWPRNRWGSDLTTVCR